MAMLVLAMVCVLAAAQSSGTVETIKHTLDGNVVTIEYLKKLADTFLLLTDTGTLYRSSDAGKTLTNLKSKTGKVNSLSVSPVNQEYVIGLGSQMHYTSTDGGITWKTNTQRLDHLEMHPRVPNLVLGSVMSDACSRGKSSGSSSVLAAASHATGLMMGQDSPTCHRLLCLSKDFGTTWDLIQDYVIQYSWAPPFEDKKGNFPSDNIIYATISKNKNVNQDLHQWDEAADFVETADYFKSTRVLVPRGNRFSFGEQSLLFVAALRDEPGKQGQVALMISRDNTTRVVFHEAFLPVALPQHSFTVVDSSEGTVFISVNHRPHVEGAGTGHIYMSDWRGLVYSLSIPYNIRRADGLCDFDRVAGVEGIYLANFMDKIEAEREEKQDGFQDMTQPSKAQRTPQAEQRGRKGGGSHIKTVITFDKGAEWRWLEPPKFDSRGKRYPCAALKSDCHLHLKGVSMSSGYAYSADHAKGIIVATGSVGQYLSLDPLLMSTFLSTDAGLTWTEVAKGSHIYEIGDFGGLILLAKDQHPTDVLLATWDQGTTWIEVSIKEAIVADEGRRRLLMGAGKQAASSSVAATVKPFSPAASTQRKRKTLRDADLEDDLEAEIEEEEEEELEREKQDMTKRRKKKKARKAAAANKNSVFNEEQTEDQSESSEEVEEDVDPMAGKAGKKKGSSSSVKQSVGKKEKASDVIRAAIASTITPQAKAIKSDDDDEDDDEEGTVGKTAAGPPSPTPKGVSVSPKKSPTTPPRPSQTAPQVVPVSSNEDPVVDINSVTAKHRKQQVGKVLIENIVTGPEPTTLKFLAYGRMVDEQNAVSVVAGGGEGVLIYLDFSSLHERACTGLHAVGSSESDYENWSPNDGRIGDRCVLGRTIRYIRKKPSRPCFNPEDTDIGYEVSHCQCTAADFQCDYGFERLEDDQPIQGTPANQSINSMECVKMEKEPFHPPPSAYAETCEFENYARKTKGYRRVPGDTCVGGEPWEAEHVPCAGTRSRIARAVFFLALVGIAAYACCAGVLNKSLDDCRSAVTDRESMCRLVNEFCERFSPCATCWARRRRGVGFTGSQWRSPASLDDEDLNIDEDGFDIQTVQAPPPVVTDQSPKKEEEGKKGKGTSRRRDVEGGLPEQGPGDALSTPSADVAFDQLIN
eukprot:g51398.t1